MTNHKRTGRGRRKRPPSADEDKKAKTLLLSRHLPGSEGIFTIMHMISQRYPSPRTKVIDTEVGDREPTQTLLFCSFRISSLPALPARGHGGTHSLPWVVPRACFLKKGYIYIYSLLQRQGDEKRLPKHKAYWLPTPSFACLLGRGVHWF
jgi:hypothetical protein